MNKAATITLIALLIATVVLTAWNAAGINALRSQVDALALRQQANKQDIQSYVWKVQKSALRQTAIIRENVESTRRDVQNLKPQVFQNTLIRGLLLVRIDGKAYPLGNGQLWIAVMDKPDGREIQRLRVRTNSHGVYEEYVLPGLRELFITGHEMIDRPPQLEPDRIIVTFKTVFDREALRRVDLKPGHTFKMPDIIYDYDAAKAQR